jgi:hypothetical protein
LCHRLCMGVAFGLHWRCCWHLRLGELAGGGQWLVRVCACAWCALPRRVLGNKLVVLGSHLTRRGTTCEGATSARQQGMSEGMFIM